MFSLGRPEVPKMLLILPLSRRMSPYWEILRNGRTILCYSMPCGPQLFMRTNLSLSQPFPLMNPLRRHQQQIRLCVLRQRLLLYPKEELRQKQQPMPQVHKRFPLSKGSQVPARRKRNVGFVTQLHHGSSRMFVLLGTSLVPPPG